MHRQISHTDELGHERLPLSLYLLTGLVGLLLFADLWPALVGWLGWTWAPTWPREVFGYSFALIAAVLGGSRILYGSVESLLEGKVGADLALAVACIAAILIRKPLVAAEVVFIGMVGEVLESVTFERTQRAIRSLVEITPQRCWVLRDGQEVRTLVAELQVGDQVVVKPGARVPADGVIVDGRSTLDTSALTGESLPIEKGPGDEALAGSLNQQGALTIECQRVAGETVVGRVLALTVSALKQKSQGERQADRLARYFLPAVLGVAAFTFLVALLGYVGPWAKSTDGITLGFGEGAKLAAYPALAVLVVACPCALILATPAAVLAALGRLAGTGVLIKGGAALERLAEVNAFAFDKTGTLTEGRLELGDLLPIGDIGADELLRAAATAEQRSEHVLAQLVLAEAKQRGLALDALDEFRAHPGGGVTARARRKTLVVGTRRLLVEQGVALPNETQELLDRLDQSGQTALLVARDGILVGAIEAHDRLRPEAADVITHLRNLGMSPILLLTGDRTAAAQAVAARLGITDVHAELLPEQKAEMVASDGQASPRRFAMVGDGINDAPALARAHVGLAVGGTGTDVAAEAGDVVFMGDPLRHLPLVVRLSRETGRIIRQNILYFAIGVNVVGIVVFSWLSALLAPRGEWYEQSPLAAVLYHQIGSILVLLNAMRLLWFEKQSSPRMTALRERMSSINAWMERRLDVDEWLHGLGHHWKKVAAVILGMSFAGYALSGLTQVNSDEVAVVRRFGRALPDELKPGLHWRWPWPIEQVDKVQPQRIRSVEIGFRSQPGKEGSDVRTWTSQHGDAIERRPEEAVLITGDDQLVELLATLHYTVADVPVYLFEVDDAEGQLRETAEAVLRELSSSWGFSRLVTGGRARFQDEVRRMVRERIAKLGKNGLGIRLESVLLQELHPPPAVVPAYHDVAKAHEEEERLQNLGQVVAIEKQFETKAEEKKTRLQADVDVARTTANARAEQRSYRYREQARRTLGLLREGELLLEALRGRPGRSEAELNAGYDRLRKDEIRRQVAWTDVRMRREIMGRTLPELDLALLDAPRETAAFVFMVEQLRDVFAAFAVDRGAPRAPREP